MTSSITIIGTANSKKELFHILDAAPTFKLQCTYSIKKRKFFKKIYTIQVTGKYARTFAKSYFKHYHIVPKKVGEFTHE